MRTRDDTRDNTRDETRDGTGNGTSADVGPGVLTDPAWVVPPVPQDVPAGSMAWLRAHVARFSSGDAHARRRAAAAARLGGPEAAGALRDAARTRTEALLRGPGPVEVMAQVARVVPVEVLAAVLELLPVTVETAGLVGEVARAYHAHGETVPAADAALARLVAACGGAWDEDTAARIGLLVQAYDATAGLIGNAARLMPAHTATAPEGDPVAGLLDRALRVDPPVRGTLRAPAGGGAPVRTSLVTADGALSFGAGAHACPGREHARALAAGVLDALRARGCRPTRPDLVYVPSANLRVLDSLEVMCA
ncbi:hypothetical protein [Streptomyces sp. NPDC017529]|uniref:hypothetical protein n=1 Tax=Streptomyces sp. NPDC017529 TaxID=3365000 RepID=UPI0037B72FE5